MRGTERQASSCMLIQEERRVTEEAPVPPDEVDLSVFGAREIRDVLKNKAHCLRAGFPPDHIIIEAFNEIRNHYLSKVGLPTYLSQMLGRLSTAQMQHCTFYAEDCRRIHVDLGGNHNQPVQRFIAKRFRWDNLPFMVEVCAEANTDQVEVRFL